MVVTGRLLAVACVGIVLALLAPTRWLGVSWVVLVMLAAVLDAVFALSPRRLHAARKVPASVRLHSAAHSTVVLRNPTERDCSLAIRDAWVPSAGATGTRHLLTLPAHQSRALQTPLRPSRRGALPAAGLTVRSAGPLGLAARQATLAAPAQLRVLPEFSSRRHLPSRLARLREMDGRSAVKTRGEGTEFDSLREYVVGDDVRSIDWRATARRTEVVVRTWRPERERRVLIILDTGRTSAVRAGTGTRLDAGVEAALLLTALADHAGDRVSLAAFDRTTRSRLTGVTGSRLLPSAAEALIDTAPTLVETDWPGLVTLARSMAPRRSLVVLISALDPAAVLSGLLPVAAGLTSQHTVVLASVTPEAEPPSGSADSTDVYDRAAAERLRRDRAVMAETLAARGIRVVQGDADELAPRLADTYLDLKAHGQL